MHCLVAPYKWCINSSGDWLRETQDGVEICEVVEWALNESNTGIDNGGTV